MDLGSLLFCVYVMIVCLPGTARCSNGDKSDCPCPKVPQIPQTKPPPEKCFNSTFRYTCIDGYVRKVGTSNLSKCRPIDGVPKWTIPSLLCIPGPARPRPTSQPPESTTTRGHTAAPTSPQMTQSERTSASVATDTNSFKPPEEKPDPVKDKSDCPCSEVPQIHLTKPPAEKCFNNTFRYTCIDGYVRKVGTSNLTKCRPIDGVPKWTIPSLLCILDPTRPTSQPPEITTTRHHTHITTDFNITTTMNVFRATKATDWTNSTSTTTESFSNKTVDVDLQVSGHTAQTAVIVRVLLVLACACVCAFIGIIYLFYRRRSKSNPPAREEEMVSMKNAGSEQEA